MAFNSALVAFFIVFLCSALSSIFKKGKPASLTRPLEGYLLANKDLKQQSVISLLLSTSFGLNPLFFQIWLGYTVGGWSLITQAASSLGFLFLVPYTRKIKTCVSLHDFLGQRFGDQTRIVAGFCSLVGIMFMICWESSVGTSAINSIFLQDKGTSVYNVNFATNLLTGAIIFGSLFYTILGGLRGNASADILLNILKIGLIVLFTFLIFWGVEANTLDNFIDGFFPSIEIMEKNLGWLGLFTTLAFGLAWQFVDNSTWQSVIAGANHSDLEVKSNLRWTSFAIFIAPGIIGTILGIGLFTIKDINTDNVFSTILSLLPMEEHINVILIFLLIVSSIMSMLDGLFLTSAFTLTIDILYPNKSFETLDEDFFGAQKILLRLRIFLVLIAITSVWGLSYLFSYLELNLFQFVYVVMVTQLALFGPSIITLSTKRVAIFPIWWPIVGALVFGFGSVLLGKSIENAYLTEGAGTLTILLSVLFTMLATKKTV